MKIDLTCPVELWQYTLPTEESPECTFVLNNLSDKVVTSVQVTLVCRDAADNLKFRQIERMQGLHAGAGERFTIMLLPSQWEDVAGTELVIEKVWFDDATIWRRGSAALTEYTSNALPKGRRLDQLRFVAGTDAVGYPEEQKNVWMCVCGRANDPQSDRCCRCERRRDTVFASFRRENVDQLISVHESKLSEVARAAREDASRLNEQREQERLHARKKRRVLIATISGVVVVSMGVAAVLIWGVPAAKYSQARSLLTSGSYDDARAAFAEMGDYGDSADMLKECDYLSAEALAADPDKLADASAAFAALGDYKDSADRSLALTYQQGQTALEKGEFEAAADAFQSLGSYEDSAELLNECTYRQAKQLLADGGYTAARVLFSSLGAYSDSAAQVVACDYAMGRDALDSGDYDRAISFLTAAGDTEDAPALLQQASYLSAEAKQADGEYEAAGKLYLQAGDYEDAVLKANNSLYELGKEQMANGNYAKAAELLSGVIPYLDSESLSWECVYQQGLAAEEANDYRQAVALYESIPHHTDAAAHLEDCRYQLALQLMEQGSNDEAEALLAAVNTKDAVSALQTLRYSMAQADMQSGDYTTAATLLEALGTYQDSEELLNACRYQLATDALSAKNYREAIEGFSALGSYQDSAVQLENATYQLAIELKTSGNLDEALQLLGSLPDNTEAKQQIADITMGEARKAEAAGDLDRACELYLALGDYGADSYNACRYQIAMNTKDAGDLGKAGELFFELGDYQDAKEQGDACWQEAYGNVADPARAAFDSGSWKTVMDTLEGFDTSALPSGYADLVGMYEQACYNLADELYADGKVYEALPYYQKIPDYKDVARKLQRRCYLVLGTWESKDGQRTAVFRTDGTCTIFGTDSLFAVDGYNILTGETADAMTATHKISNVTDSDLSLRVLSTDVVYSLTHTEWVTATEPSASQTPAASTSPAATPSASASPAVSPSPAPTFVSTATAEGIVGA